MCTVPRKFSMKKISIKNFAKFTEKQFTILSTQNILAIRNWLALDKLGDQKW